MVFRRGWVAAAVLVSLAGCGVGAAAEGRTDSVPVERGEMEVEEDAEAPARAALGRAATSPAPQASSSSEAGVQGGRAAPSAEPALAENTASVVENSAAAAMLAGTTALEEMGDVLQSGSVAQWTEMTSPDCGYCAAVAETGYMVREGHMGIVGGEINAQYIPTGLWTPDQPVTFWYPIDVQELTVLDHLGVEQETLPAHSTGFDVVLEFVDGRWLVTGLGEVPVREDSAALGAEL